MNIVPQHAKFFIVICATLLFIHGVIKGTSRSSVSTSLVDHHTFLDVFADLCFHDVTGLLRYACVPDVILVDVQRNLHSLNKTLAAHREAWRHVGVASKAKRSEPAGKADTVPSDAIASRSKWRDDIRQRSEVWKEKAGPGVHSALFEEEEMDALLSACVASIDRLRHSLAVALLITRKSPAHCPTGIQARHLGIAQIIERQRRLGLEPSDNRIPLPGRLKKSISTNDLAKTFLKRVYGDGREEIDVVVEVRSYSDMPTSTIRQLLWRLGSLIRPTSPAQSKQTCLGYGMLTLDCLGYIDDPSCARTLILYRSPSSYPSASDPPTLHDTISKGWATKLSLNQRFRTARVFAASVLDVHTSGSIHSDLNSHKVAMLPYRLDDPEPLPHLLAWTLGSGRSEDSTTLRSALYCHSTRFGQPCSTPTTEHDIYSLGIVLLEIGLWTTMSTVFAKLLEATPRFDPRNGQVMAKKVKKVILDLAQSADLSREMGVKYALVVQKCLDWRCEDTATSLLRFRKEVVDALDDGCQL
jgi:hypothetical protein